MKKVILLHGTCSSDEYYNADKYRSLSNSHWMPWMQKQLLVRDIEAHTPEIFQAYEPDYEKWLKELERYDIDENTVLVGHSRGGGFLVRWLSTNNKKVGRVVLVAPSLRSDSHGNNQDLVYSLREDIGANTKGVSVFYSTDDMDTILESVDTLKQHTTGVNFKEFSGKGHFTYGAMQTEEFPELLEEVIS